jgi:hypothetical protein
LTPAPRQTPCWAEVKMSKEPNDYYPKTKAHPNPYWMIYYEDQDVRPRIFLNEETARKVYAETSVNWNCHLFKGVESNHA